MKGDISADFHAPEKRYSGVRAQQGRVLTDGDFNAAMDVVDDAMEALVRSLICAAGTPDGGFGISAPVQAEVVLPDETSVSTYDLTISPGSFVLGGKALVLRQAVQFLTQPDWLSQLLDSGVLPPAPVDGRTDLVYLESIVQPVRALEDREIQERALGSADTTTRLRPQLKVRIEPDTVDECVVAMEGLRATLAGTGGTFSDDGTELLSNARLSVSLSAPGDALDPCAPRTISGYLGAENQTIKVMLTRPEFFVWAYDHGEPLYRVQIDQDEVVFLTPPRDPVLYPGTDQVIEILPWDALLPNREKSAAPLGHLARLTGEYDPAENRIAYDGSLPSDWQDWLDQLPNALLGRDDVPPRYFYARIWRAPDGGGVDQPAGAGVALDQTGIELTFSGTGFAGDYWTASFRPDAPALVVPWGLLDAPGLPPTGPRRFYAPLALLDWTAPVGGLPTAEVQDCRNRFRRLCQIKGCCSFQVGDGRTTFGDFNVIQDAVDALPAEGGEICLLPGIHEGRIDLSGRSNITIHGCGRRTIVTTPDALTTPLIQAHDAQDITLRDFAIRTADAQAFQADQGLRRALLQNLRIRVASTAVFATGVAGLTIRDCVVRARVLDQAITLADIPGLGPLAYLTGESIVVEGSTIEAEQFALPDGQVEPGPEAEPVPKNRLAMGGLWIGGDSTNIRIRDNRIAGGNGHGITLGSVELVGGGRPFGGFSLFPFFTLDDGGCPEFDPPGTFRPPQRDPNTPRPPRLESEGPLIDLRIEDNLIEEHGLCGISVAYWFVAIDDGAEDGLDDIEIEDAVISGNRIQRCMLLDIGSGLPLDFAFSIGFGGITLASAADLQVENNDIRRCGPGRTPICGIYIRLGEQLSITDNRIYDNGRPGSPTEPLLVGNIGGIVLSQVEGAEEAFAQGLRQTPAVIVRENTVVSPEGRAFEVIGSGQMLIESNSLTTHGNNSLGLLIAALVVATGVAPAGSYTQQGVQGQLRAFMAQLLGSAVAILNTGVNPNFAILLGGLTANAGTNNTTGTAGATLRSPDTGLAPDNVVNPLVGLPPQGPVLFNDNHVTFDAAGDALTVSLCSVGILSLDDVGMQDNQCMVDAFIDFVLVNTLAIGLVSVRVQGNRFREIVNVQLLLDDQPGVGLPLFGATILSAMTFGIMNATEMNQGTHCFLSLGLLRPRIIENPNDPGNPEALPVLQTNRTLIGGLAEGLGRSDPCTDFFELSTED